MFANPDDPEYPSVRKQEQKLCAIDGVRVGQSRAGKWIHLGELSKEVDSEHEVEPVSLPVYFLRRSGKEQLRQTAADMLKHHGTLHPDVDCAWAINLRAALRS